MGEVSWLQPVATMCDTGGETYAHGLGTSLRSPASNFRAKRWRNEQDTVDLVWDGAVGQRPTDISMIFATVVLIFCSINCICVRAVYALLCEDLVEI